MDSMEHSHVPWVVLLVKAASIWMRSVGRSISVAGTADVQHDGQVPRDLSDDGGLDEQKEFKALLNGMRHKADEENFDEANAQAYQVWGETQVATFVQKPSGSAQNQISQDLQLLLEDAAVCNISKEVGDLSRYLLTNSPRMYIFCSPLYENISRDTIFRRSPQLYLTCTPRQRRISHYKDYTEHNSNGIFKSSVSSLEPF